MKQTEAIKKARKLTGDTGYSHINANIEMISNSDGDIKTECLMGVTSLKKCILKKGRNFAECLFLIECELNAENEEDHDDRN